MEGAGDREGWREHDKNFTNHAYFIFTENCNADFGVYTKVLLAFLFYVLEKI